MALPPHKMIWLTILAGLMVLAEGDSSVEKFIATSTETPKEISTTNVPSQPPPLPMEAIVDLFKAPLTAFRGMAPEKHQENSPMLALLTKMQVSHKEKPVESQVGRAENNTAPAPIRPLLNLWSNAGQSLGSAANTLTGWINNQIVPSTTTKAPQIVVQIQPNNQRGQQDEQQAVNRGNRRNTQANRIGPVQFEIDDYEDDDDDFDDEGGNYDDDEFEPTQQRKQIRVTQSRPKNTYFYVEEDNDDDRYEYEEDDDDYDYDYAVPVRQSDLDEQLALNRIRASKNRKRVVVNQNNKNRNKKQKQKIQNGQNGQNLQFVQQKKRPSNTQIKIQRRPSGTTFELIPISQNQALNSLNKKNKPVNNMDSQNQIVIPIPQGVSQNGQQRPAQFITIPLSQLESSAQQSKPLIVRYPQQQAPNRKRRPVQKPSRVVIRQPNNRFKTPQNNVSPTVAILTQQNIKDILKFQEISTTEKPQISNLPVTLEENKEETVNASENEASEKPDVISKDDKKTENNNEDGTAEQAFIVVGADDDNESDVSLSRKVNRPSLKRISFRQRKFQ